MMVNKFLSVPGTTRLIYTVGFLWLAAIAGCSTATGQHVVAEYNRSPLAVPIPSKLSADQVQRLMAQTLVGRKWQVIQQSPEEVIGTLNHRSYQAKAILRVDNGLVKILSESKYKNEPAVPEDWLENLRKDLGRNFQR